ncbi:MAG TPA: DUF4249 family protein [Rubricoccaceae bacterium]|nr:DUF4249 family protein [Rubricoccaceae bacterium]
MRVPLLAFAAALLRFAVPFGVLAGCEFGDPDPFIEQVVVSGAILAGAPLTPLQLARTGPVDEFYDPNNFRVTDAEVFVRLLTPGGTVEASYPYAYDAEENLYVPTDSAIVLPGRTYRFVARVPGFADSTWAETTVPGTFVVARPPPDTLVYQEEPGGPPVDVTRSAYPGRQAVYVLTVRSLDPVVENLTPFARDLVEERDVNPEDLINGASPVLNEENYETNPDGSLRVRVPWLAFNFYGPYRFLITALDDALVQFLQTQAIQFIPTTLSPGEIPNVTTNVRNGVGVFGAYAQAQAESFIARP